jgi:hypothetical protein
MSDKSLYKIFKKNIDMKLLLKWIFKLNP